MPRSGISGQCRSEKGRRVAKPIHTQSVINAERDIVDLNCRLEVGNKQSRILNRKLDNPTNFS